MRAMILAAGYGTRLWPLTADRTKPAIPVRGRPLVGYVAEYLARNGCDRVLVNLHHQPESVRKALGDGSRFGVQLDYVYEPEILGTSGALDNARGLLDASTFVVVNGKIVTDINLAAALETHRRTNALATLVLKENRLRERFSVVLTEGERITGFGGMPARASDNADLRQAFATNPDADQHEAEAQAPLMFTGIQILEPRIFDYIPRGIFSHSTTDVYPQAIAQNERIVAHVAEGMWHELSTIPRYLEINLALMKAVGRDLETGENCLISPDASVEESVLWDDVRIEAGAIVLRSILADGVLIRAGQRIENAAVVRAELVRGERPPAKALPGEFLGDNFVVPLPQ
ncbi:MAG TPA: NDP-sugar synthase [Pyrinomonadaceae bacterium]